MNHTVWPIDLTSVGDSTSQPRANWLLVSRWIEGLPSNGRCDLDHRQPNILKHELPKKVRQKEPFDGFNTLQCALNSCSCLFRFSFIATMERSFWRTLSVRKNERKKKISTIMFRIASSSRVVQYCDIMRFMIRRDRHHKVSPDPNP